MVQEISTKPVPTEIIEPEIEELKVWGRNIGIISTYFMNTFFQDDTWSIRQAGAYGFPILDSEIDGKNHDWEKEENLLRDVTEALGDRSEYFDAAYHFPDSLSALAAWCSGSFMLEKTDEPLSVRIQKFKDRIRQEVREESQLLENFLNTGIKQAISIKLNSKTGEFSIEDLTLDSEQIRARWDEFLTSIFQNTR